MSLSIHIGFNGLATLFGVAGLMLPIGAALVALLADIPLRQKLEIVGLYVRPPSPCGLSGR